MHVSNHHKGLLDVQVEELGQVKQRLNDILLSVESTLARKQTADIESLAAKDRGLRDLAEQLQQKQMERIRNGSSKTRLNILFYAILGNAVMLSRQNSGCWRSSRNRSVTSKNRKSSTWIDSDISEGERVAPRHTVQDFCYPSLNQAPVFRHNSIPDFGKPR